MVELDLDIDKTKLNLAQSEKDKSPAQLTSEVIKNVCMTYGIQKKGLNKKERKLYYRVCEKLEKAKPGSLTFEDKEAGFIKKSFDEIRITPNNLIKLVEEKVDTMKEVN